MNIILINPEYPSASSRDHGGIASYIYTMANALADNGNTVSILAREGTIAERLNPGVTMHLFNHKPPQGVLSFFKKRFNGPLYWEQGCSQAALDLVLALHAEKPVDIVEIPEYNGLAYQFTGPLPFPVVITFHTPTQLVDELNQVIVTKKHRRWYEYEQKALKNAVAYRCPSKALAARIQSMYGIAPERITIIPNPIPLSLAPDVSSKNDMKRFTFDILFAGRLEQRKGAQLILNNINNILDIDPSIQLTFAGETRIYHAFNFRDAIENKLSPDKRKRVWFLGPIDRYSLSMLFKRSDAFFFPSLFENSPYSLLEAMASGLPVVGADTSGTSEIIEHKVNGLLFSLDKPDEIVSCFKDIFGQPALRETLAANAIEYVKKYHEPRAIERRSVVWFNQVRSEKKL